MNKKLILIAAVLVSFCVYAQTPQEDLELETQDHSQLTPEPLSDEDQLPQMQEDPSYNLPTEYPDDYEYTDTTQNFEDSSDDYEN